jgi:pseudouridine synthase
VRLQKVIARAGITSRRKAEEMILEGRVKVNQKVVSAMGVKVDPDSDIVEVDGRRITPRTEPALYILINKPRGVISALSDPQKRPVVTALLKRIKTRVWPVGRLDYDAEGALLLTNDGDLGNRLLHPRYAVPKRYLIKVRGVPGPAKLKKLEQGVRLEDGRTLPCKVRLSRVTKENSWLELVVYEGRNRLVKRMCKAIGHPVSKLKRLEFAGLKVRSLKPGEYRTLTEKELERLRGFNPTNEKK